MKQADVVKIKCITLRLSINNIIQTALSTGNADTDDLSQLFHLIGKNHPNDCSHICELTSMLQIQHFRNISKSVEFKLLSENFLQELWEILTEIYHPGVSYMKILCKMFAK